MDTADLDDAPSFIAPMPSGGRRRPKRRGKQNKRTPKYKDMVIRAIKSLREPKGVTHQAIAKKIEEKHNKRNDFVIKHILRWLVQKRVLVKTKGRYKLTGKRLAKGKGGKGGKKGRGRKGKGRRKSKRKGRGRRSRGRGRRRRRRRR